MIAARYVKKSFFSSIAISTAVILASQLGASASTSLLYLEAQGIGGYSSIHNKPVFYSLSNEDTMQKPGIGLDYIQKFSGDGGDIATLAIQGRLAYDQTRKDWNFTEPQLYNAYVKIKPSPADIWIGHNRPALGLSSYFDSHSQLLPTLAMTGFGFDRDWGGGIYREFSFGDIGISSTTGSGMPVYAKGNYLVAGRISFGILNQDNYTVGLSSGYGRILDTMGYHLMMEEPVRFAMGGIDTAFLVDRLELRAETMMGKRDRYFSYAGFIRLGYNFMEENRLKLELQYINQKVSTVIDNQYFAGATFIATSDSTIRLMYRYDEQMRDHAIIMQLYLYVKAY